MTMTCSQFIEAFSDLIDETGSIEVREAAARHRGVCERCRHYAEVFMRGREALRSGEDVLEVDEYFHSRLQHRLHHVDDERALARSRAGVHPAVLVLGAAAVFATVVGAPVLLGPDPEVELSPIVVNRPAPRPLGLRIPLPSMLPASLSPAALELDGDDLWRQPTALFYDYAPVRARYRAGGAPTAASPRMGLQ